MEVGGGHRGGGLLVHLVRAAVYLVLVLWLAWPLPAHLGSHLPHTTFSADFDTLYTTWALGWETHAITTDPARILDANIYHPTPTALLYGPTAFGALPFFAPTFLATGNAVLAINLTLLVALGLTALGAHLVVTRWTGSEPAGFVAGAVFLTNRWMWQWAPTAPQFAVLVYMPWIMYLAAAPMGGRATWLLLALVVLQALAEPVYLAPSVLAPLAILAAVRLASPGARRSGVRLLTVTVAAATVLAPLYVGYARIRATNPALAAQTLWRNEALMPLLLPTRLAWDGLAGMGPARLSAGLLLLLLAGVLCVALTAPSDDVRRAWRQAGFWTAASLLLSTRVLALFDLPPFELPHFRLLGRLAPSLLATMRSPARLGLVATVGVAMLAGLAVAACARAAGRLVPRRAAELGIAVAVAIALLAGHREALPELAVTPAIRLDSSVLAAVGREHGPLLELPVDPIRADTPGAKLAIEHARAMFRSLVHWRPLLNGYSSYWPSDFPGRMAAAAELPDARALEGLRTTAGLAAVLVDLDALDADARTRWLAVTTSSRTDLRLVARDEHSLLFDVAP